MPKSGLGGKGRLWAKWPMPNCQEYEISSKVDFGVDGPNTSPLLFAKVCLSMKYVEGKGTGCHLSFTETSNIKCWSGGGGVPGKHPAVERVLKGLWGKHSWVIEGTEGERISFQEAFPRALQTFSSSNLVAAVLSNSVVAGQNAGKCFMGLGSEEGAYTLHWQAVLPGGTAWMAQGHWEPSSPTDSTPLPSPYLPSASFFFPSHQNHYFQTTGGQCPQRWSLLKYFSDVRRQHLTRKGQREGR